MTLLMSRLNTVSVEIVNSAGYDWGNLVVQLIIAGATIGTLVWAIRVSRGEAERASTERRDRLDFEERAQAAQISAWERQRAELPDGSPAPGPQDPAEFLRVLDQVEERRTIYVHNNSSAAIYDVVVRYFDVSQVRDADHGEESELRGAWFHSILPPEPTPRSIQVTRVPNCGALSEDLVLEVEFRDGAGRYWVRHPDGDLVRREDLESLTSEQRRERRFSESERDPSFKP